MNTLETSDIELPVAVTNALEEYRRGTLLFDISVLRNLAAELFQRGVDDTNIIVRLDQSVRRIHGSYDTKSGRSSMTATAAYRARRPSNILDDRDL